MKCKKCGKENEDEANFCSFCSTKLKTTCKCWVKKQDNYNCGESSCPGYGLFLIQKRGVIQMLEKKFDYQKEKSIVSSIAEEFVKKCINDGLTMKQLEILSEEVQERIRVSIERAKYETGVVKTNSAVSQCSNIPPCPQRLSETDLQPEIKKAMEKFVLRVLKGREDANPQETAILPEILKRLERR